MSFKVNVSIGDFSPLLREPEFLFKGLKDTGADGIELWIGVKSRWTPEHYNRLSKKYDLPIVSVHQPLWAMTGVFFDEGFFEVAKKLGVRYVTCHPLPKLSFQDARMRAYLKRLAGVQKRTGIEILVENMPQEYRSGLLNRFFPLDARASSVMDLYEAVTEFGLKMTFDTDHAHVPEPHEEKWFDTVFPAIANVHLSSFAGDKRHLPLYIGDLKTANFMRHLEKKSYDGLLTLEVTCPKSVTFLGYDFTIIKRSTLLLR